MKKWRKKRKPNIEIKCYKDMILMILIMIICMKRWSMRSLLWRKRRKYLNIAVTRKNMKMIIDFSRRKWIWNIKNSKIKLKMCRSSKKLLKLINIRLRIWLRIVRISTEYKQRIKISNFLCQYLNYQKNYLNFYIKIRVKWEKFLYKKKLITQSNF